MALNEEENVNVNVYGLGSEDIADVLPNDPFGMEFIRDINLTLPRDPFGMDFRIEATFEAISGWVDDFDLKAYGFESNEVAQDKNNDIGKRIESDEGDSGGYGYDSDDSVFAEYFVWTRSLEYEQGYFESEEEEGDWESDEVDADSVIYRENSLYIVEDSWYFGCEKYEIEKDENSGDGGLKGLVVFQDNINSDDKYEIEKDENNGDGGLKGLEVVQDNIDNDDKYEIEHVKYENNDDGGAAATDIIIFVAGYLNLDVKCLLTIESVCKSMRDVVRKDPYLWTKIHIDYSLSHKICNDDLLKLTDRAQGELCSLAILNCTNITNDGLQRVLERNLKLTKLSVAGSMKLSLEGVLNSLKVFNSIAKPGIKHIRIGDIKHLRSTGELRSITNEHLRELKLLLGADEDAKPSNYKPRFYREGEIYLSLDDERVIDIETCPRCQMLKQVYDCSTENCRVAKTCRACIICIARCTQCGCCLENTPFEEGFSFEFRCWHCCPMGMTRYHIRTLFHFMPA